MTYAHAEAEMKKGGTLVYSFYSTVWTLRDSEDRFSFEIREVTAKKLKQKLNLRIENEIDWGCNQHRYKYSTSEEKE